MISVLSRTLLSSCFAFLALTAGGSGVALGDGSAANPSSYSGTIALAFDSPVRSTLGGALRLTVVDAGGGKATFTGTFRGILTIAWFRVPVTEPVAGTITSGLNPGLTATVGGGLNDPLDVGLSSGLNSGLNSDPTGGLNEGLNSGLSSGLNGGLNAGLNSGLNSGLNLPSFAVPFVGSLQLRCTTCLSTGA